MAMSAILLVILGIVLIAGQIILGAFEIYYVNQYKEYNMMCSETWGNLRNWLLAAGIIDIIAGCFTLFGICCSVLLSYTDSCESEEGKKASAGCNCVQTGQVIIGIWSVATYYQLTKTTACHAYWMTNAPILWNFIMVHFGLFWVSIGLLGIGIIACCCFCCASICIASKETTTNVHPRV